MNKQDSYIKMRANLASFILNFQNTSRIYLHVFISVVSSVVQFVITPSRGLLNWCPCFSQQPEQWLNNHSIIIHIMNTVNKWNHIMLLFKTIHGFPSCFEEKLNTYNDLASHCYQLSHITTSFLHLTPSFRVLNLSPTLFVN
jgi:hypothetical protein